MEKWYDRPTMVRFIDNDNQTCYGIGYRNEIICACCGSTFESDEIEIVDELPWTDIKKSIEQGE